MAMCWRRGLHTWTSHSAETETRKEPHKEWTPEGKLMTLIRRVHPGTSADRLHRPPGELRLAENWSHPSFHTSHLLSHTCLTLNYLFSLSCWMKMIIRLLCGLE